MKKAIILMLALGFAQTNLSIAQSTEDLASKTNKKTLTQTAPAKENLQKNNNKNNNNDISETINNEVLETEEITTKTISKKRKAAKAAIILFLGLATLYGTDFALEFAVNNLNLPASFFQYYEFGTLASAVNTYLYQIPTTEIQNQIDKIMVYLKPLQIAATLNGIKNFVDERGKSVKNLGTWIKNIITF